MVSSLFCCFKAFFFVNLGSNLRFITILFAFSKRGKKTFRNIVTNTDLTDESVHERQACKIESILLAILSIDEYIEKCRVTDII